MSTPSIRREPHEERRPRPFITSRMAKPSRRDVEDAFTQPIGKSDTAERGGAWRHTGGTCRDAHSRCVVEDGWPLRRAAERFQVSTTTAARWAIRYRAAGPAPLDRAPRPLGNDLLQW